MGSVSVKTTSGKDAGVVELAPEFFGVQPNVPVMHQVVTAQLAHRRAGTQSTKTRAEVSGGGRKPFRQKGTGNARQGSTRAPQFSGGGVALGPKPRSYSQKVNKKVTRLALASALSDRFNAGKIVVVDSWDFSAPRTKDAVAALGALGIDGSALVVVGRDEEAVAKSFRNLPNVQLLLASELNTYDVLCNEYIVFSRNTLPVASEQMKAAADKHSARVAEAAAEVAEAVAQAEAEGVTEPYGPGSAAPLADGSAPAGFDIKGNADSMLYHVPGSRYYGATKAEVWFATEEAAEAAGFAKPGSSAADDEEES